MTKKNLKPGRIKHPFWCDPTECTVSDETGLGIHRSQVNWVDSGRDNVRTAVQVQEDAPNPDDPTATVEARLVVTEWHGAREGVSIAWRAQVWPQMLFALRLAGYQMHAQMPRPSS